MMKNKLVKKKIWICLIVGIIILFVLQVWDVMFQTCETIEPQLKMPYEEKSIRIGIIDSGIADLRETQGLHQEQGWNYIDESDNTEDKKGHGTEIAVLISEIAPEAIIIPLKVSDNDYMTIPEDVIRAIYDGVDKYECNILNLSLSIPDSDIFREAVQYAEQKGVLIVSAVGNQGDTFKRNKIYYPAGYETVVGVGSVDKHGEHSEFSQQNSSVYVTTIGENIMVEIDEACAELSGTSYSAAVVSAHAALKKWNSPAEYRQLLMECVTDCGEEGYDELYGWGVLWFEEMERVLTE